VDNLLSPRALAKLIWEVVHCPFVLSRPHESVEDLAMVWINYLPSSQRKLVLYAVLCWTIRKARNDACPDEVTFEL
jgi:hypothetical protein